MRSKWHCYWFRRSRYFDLAVCRIIAVLTQLLVLLAFRDSLFSAANQPPHLYDPLLVVRSLLLPFGDHVFLSAFALKAIYVTTLIAGIGGLVGLFTRTSLGLFAVGSILLHGYNYSFGEIHHPEALMMMFLVFLALSPSGTVLSMDDLRRRGGTDLREYLTGALDRQGEYAAWPLLLMQAMFALVYFDAAISKLSVGGLNWVNGYTLQYYFGQDGLRWGSLLGLWLSEHHILARLVSMGALLFELTFFVVLIRPSLAWLYLPAGVMMHTGIYLTMKAPFFQYIALYSVFVPWAVILLGKLRVRGDTNLVTA